MTFHQEEPPAPNPHLQRLRLKAKNEIGEVDHMIPDKIMEVRQLINADNSVNPPPKQYDEFILRCLRARKYDVHRAAKTYKKLCHVHHSIPEVTDYFQPSVYNDLLKGHFVSLLSPRDHLGRHLLFVQLQNWNASKHCLDEALATLFMLIDQATCSIDTQLNGVVVVVDFKGFGFWHARQVTPSRIQGVVSIIQEAFPVRFKELHFFNHPVIFNMIFAVAKPFLKEKMRKRIFFHGHDVSAIHKYISPSLLPEHIGGQLPSNECYDKESIQHLMKRDDHFKGMKEHFILTNKGSSGDEEFML